MCPIVFLLRDVSNWANNLNCPQCQYRNTGTRLKNNTPFLVLLDTYSDALLYNEPFQLFIV